MIPTAIPIMIPIGRSLVAPGADAIVPSLIDLESLVAPDADAIASSAMDLESLDCLLSIGSPFIYIVNYFEE